MSALAVGDVPFHVEVTGDGPPLVLLHGFTGSGATWSGLVEAFAADYRLVRIDLLGHGRSASPPDLGRYSLEHSVEDLRAILDRLGLERVDLLGYSLGGRVALNFAVTAPERVHALVLESASPGIPSAEERAARVRGDEQLAELLEREGIARFVDYWENIPLFASQRALPPDVRARLRSQRLRGNPLGLANSLRGMGAGAMTPLFDRLGDLNRPTLLVVGELDAKYRELGETMRAALPDATLQVIANAGHAAHVEQPEAFARVVREFLDRVSRRAEGLEAPP